MPLPHLLRKSYTSCLIASSSGQRRITLSLVSSWAHSLAASYLVHDVELYGFWPIINFIKYMARVKELARHSTNQSPLTNTCSLYMPQRFHARACPFSVCKNLQYITIDASALSSMILPDGKCDLYLALFRMWDPAAPGLFCLSSRMS